MTTTPVVVVGIGADGWPGLAPAAREHVLRAEVLLGGERHLDLVPPVAGQVRRPWPRPLDGLPELLGECAGRRVVALASGDPLVSGIGTTLVRLLGREAVTVVPAVSSVALARARMGWSAEESTVISLVGRDVAALRRELAAGQRVLVLSADETTPAAVAGLLEADGFAGTAMTVLGDLGAAEESRHVGTSSERARWSGPLPRLHVLALEVAAPTEEASSWATGLRDDRFEHDGQLTKRDVRASALARLEPRPGALLWDVGAGAGSIGIEWLRTHPRTEAVAVESDAGRAERITRNAAALGVPRLHVVEGRAPEVLRDLPRPDAVFVGGGATAPGLLDRCREALRPGGRLVAHAVTLETEQVLLAAYAEHGGELTRLSVEHVAPIGGRFTGWTPSRAVTQWAWRKPAGSSVVA
ncbi:precorrin-6y C5,15-methyltransferase (decarboxylating) subunit CbiE [Nocardioides sp. SYSU DS0651]|uniref:precorrin-6y C5,15-methyltransferase (decarboxylating) subunit CbiE n=1 Tax=Nocardioides sp. SYSU DS0651 TaxID=3415955 RepID=UPI003F4B948C